MTDTNKERAEFEAHYFAENGNRLYCESQWRGWKAHASLAAKAPAAEPVAVVCDVFELRWIGAGPIAPLVKRHNIKVGSLLYTAPPAPTEQWMPIETAPEDGSRLILTDGAKVFRGGFAKVEFKEHRDADGNYIDQTDPDAYWLNFEDGDVCHPTHWQPEPALPAPPQGAAKGDGNG